MHSAPYCAEPATRQFARKKISRLLKEDIIEPITTKLAYRIVFATKQDRSLRLSVDYLKRNALTVRDSYPLTSMDHCINVLGEVRIFSTLHTNSSSWHLEIDERDREKTASNSHHSLYKFVRMRFGLKNAPVTFQRATYVI